MSEDEAVTADPRVVADDHWFRRIDVRHLQHDGAVPEHEPRFRQLWTTDVHLLAYPRILADLDGLTRYVGHRADGRVPANADLSTLNHGQQADLDVVADLHVTPDDDAAECQPHLAADPVAKQRPICPHLQGTGEPPEQHQVAERNP